MRITSDMYYKNIYGGNNALLSKGMFDVNRQIASGLKIKYAKDDVAIFSDTMRLDNEIVVLGQIKSSVLSAYKISDQTDIVLNEFDTSMNRTRTLLLKAANGTNSPASYDAISQELRSIETHFKNLANSSINGQFLFSGSDVDTRPIAPDGTYLGNNSILSAFTGSGTRQQYNITGEELFLGEKKLVRREVTVNMPQFNMSEQYPDFTNLNVPGKIQTLKPSDTVRDLMGDGDNAIDTVNFKHFFYIRGTNSLGDSFQQKISMRDDDKIDALLTQIGNMYGNTPDLKVVNVSMNDMGQIVIEDKKKGSSRLDFHIVGATDYSGGLAADVLNIDNLGDGEKNFEKIVLGTSTAVNPNLYIKEFIKSSLTSATGVPATNAQESTIYDRTEFVRDGARLSSNVPQIIKGTNDFATNSTKISEVATSGSLDGKSFNLEGVDINGFGYAAKINFATAGSTFTLDGGVTNYSIFDVAGTPRVAVPADEMTYKQLMDVINMVVTSNLPAAAPGSEFQYDAALQIAELRGSTFLSYDGKIQFEDVNTGNTKARIAMYDSNSGDFTLPASVMTFNTNNAVTVRDPKTDFFKTLDEIIIAVENYKLYPDGSSGDVRSVGIENAIAMLDDLQDHIYRSHSQVGAQSNALNTASLSVGTLEISSMSLRSSIIDTDLAQASLTLAQLNTNYQAMLSTVGKISKLSLVNYL